MRNIAKGPEPESLREYRKKEHSRYGDYREKQDLRKSLVGEQRGLCCYCMCRIIPVELQMKIEHWRSQSRYPDQQLTYSNLLGACLGGQRSTPADERDVDRHCDTSKGDKDLGMNPASEDVAGTISYLPDGRIRSSNDNFDAELSSILNLNSYAMVNRRKRAIASFLRLIEKRETMPRQKWEVLARHWNGEGHDQPLEAYCGVVVAWIRKYKLQSPPALR
jgi:uncharacterized protein (TIGR02646 family)